MQRKLLSLIFLVLLPGVLVSRAAEGLQPMEFTIDGVTRTALIYAPASAKTNGTPVVFVFHGHGGSARQVARGFAMEQHWPEAISVYMQGLPTPGTLTDPEGVRAGWQMAPAGQGDRDLKFFDAVLARLKQDYHIDAKRIYATGHSNGGGFVYLLWMQREDVFAAVAPSAAAASYARRLKPKPAMIIGGEKDPLVKFTWQQATINAVRKVNGCETEGKPWNKLATIYTSKTGTPLVTLIHPGGHQFDQDAPELIVQFFKEYPER